MRKDPLKPVHDWYSRRKTRKAQAVAQSGDPKALASYMRWSDHGIFRDLWTNMAEIAPGVWRSNFPPAHRYARLSAMGIKTILTLRGTEEELPFLYQQRLCEAHGITLRAVRLDARRAPIPDQILAVLDILRTAERPILFHCKSGADRAGLIAALYLLVIENRPEDEARTMLSRRFLHFKGSRTGVLDMFLDSYLHARASDGIAFEDWLTQVYEPSVLQAVFDATR